MYQVGIDIGSSAAKVAVIEDNKVVKTMTNVLPEQENLLK